MRARQQEKCARTSVCPAEPKPCVLCGGWRRDAGTDWPELPIEGSQSKAAWMALLPQPPSVTAAFNTLVEEGSKPWADRAGFSVSENLGRRMKSPFPSHPECHRTDSARPLMSRRGASFPG